MSISLLKKGMSKLMSWRHGSDRDHEYFSAMNMDDFSNFGKRNAAMKDLSAVKASSLKQALLYVYRLRALQHMSGGMMEEKLAEIIPGSIESFLGLSVSDGYDYDSDSIKLEDIMKFLLQAHENQLEALSDKDEKVFRGGYILLDALGMNEPVYREITRYLAVALEDEETTRLLDAWTDSPSSQDHLEVMSILTRQDLTVLAEAVRNMANAGVVHLVGGSFYSILNDEGVRYTKRIRTLLRQDITSVEDLIRKLCPPLSIDEDIGLDDFDHVRDSLALARRFLESGNRDSGASHVLLVGPPGTGKTTCAMLIAREMGRQAAAVAVEDGDGDQLSDPMRLSDYRLKQALFKVRSEKTLIVFDEVESIFGSPLFPWMNSGSISSKARLTSIMDDARVSTVWIANHTEDWDPAFLRRFGFIVRIDNPPLKTRKAQLQNICASLDLADGFMEELARRKLPVSLVSRAVDIVSADQAEEEIRSVINGYLSALGVPPIAGIRERALPPFDEAYLNLSVPGSKIFSALDHAESLRFLFSGPPGSGKTELARQIADHAGRELLDVKASELLDKYVGETEKHIASVFSRAAVDGSVLLIDEADSMLRSRVGAVASWEVSQVNELLVHIESFSGILILGTNFVDALDEALIRRMDFKVKFLALRLQQRIDLFLHVLRYHGCEEAVLEDGVLRELAEMDKLVVGDFRPAARRLMAMREPFAPATLLRELREEYQARYPRRGIGFAVSV